MNDFEIMVFTLCGAIIAFGVVCLWWNNKSFKRLMELREKREDTARFVDRTNKAILGRMPEPAEKTSSETVQTAKYYAESAKTWAEFTERRTRAVQAMSPNTETASVIIVTDYRNPPQVDLTNFIPAKEAEVWKNPG